jgi:hypothetical protein
MDIFSPNFRRLTGFKQGGTDFVDMRFAITIHPLTQTLDFPHVSGSFRLIPAV